MSHTLNSPLQPVAWQGFVMTLWTGRDCISSCSGRLRNPSHQINTISEHVKMDAMMQPTFGALKARLHGPDSVSGIRHTENLMEPGDLFQGEVISTLHARMMTEMRLGKLS